MGSNRDKKGTNWVCVIFFAIILFLLVFFPLFGNALRYKFGAFFSQIYTTIGTILLFFGTINILYGIISFFLKSPFKGFQYILLGIVLLTFGSYFIIPSSFNAGKEIPKGYH